MALADDFRAAVMPMPQESVSGSNWWDLFYFILALLSAVYLILGAPPFLKWATRSEKNARQ